MTDQTTNDDSLDLATTTTYQAGVVQAAAYRLLKRFTDDCLKEYGITTTQWFIIGTVLAAGDAGIRLTELSKQVDTTLSFLTNSVNLLESKGYLVRGEHSQDSRSKVIYVPASMRPKCLTIESTLREKMRQGLYRNIKPADLQIYVKVLYQLSQLNTAVDVTN